MRHSSFAVVEVDASTPTVKCPFCGYGAGIYRVAAEYRTPSTPIRCLSCRHEAVLEEWQCISDCGVRIQQNPHASGI